MKTSQSSFKTTQRRDWIRSMRQSLGMTLRRAAEAMNCEFTYSFTPKSDIKLFIEQQAYGKAKKILMNADLHMSLEDQQVTSDLEIRIQSLKKNLLHAKAKQLLAFMKGYSPLLHRQNLDHFA